MKRRLVKQAGQAVTLTLPIEWVRENRLSAGDEVDLEVSEKSIVVKSQGKVVSKKTKVDFSGFESNRIRLYLSALYARGFDEIEAKLDKDIHYELSQNIGFAVTEKRGCTYKIRDISGVATEDLDEIFKRVFQMLLSYYDLAIDDVFLEKKADTAMINSADTEINKFTLFLERAIIKHAYPDSATGKIMFAYADSLERIGDDINRLWSVAVHNKVRQDKEVKEIIFLSKKGLEKAFETKYQFSDQKIVELRAIKDEMRKKFIKLKNLDGATAQFVGHAARILDECTDLTHLVLMSRS
jgi:phosphate uptake regulator